MIGIGLILISCTNSSKKEIIVQTKANKMIVKTKFKHGEILSDSTNILENEIHKIELSYTVWGCACANWINVKDLKIEDTNLEVEKHIFIEPANENLELPDSFNAMKNNIKVTGQFYINEDYPKGTIQTEEDLKKAKVFRYTKIEIVRK